MPDRIQQARSLRQATTDAERLLWRRLRERFVDVKFRRQHPVGPYIVDFFSYDQKLAIELDGGQHFLPREALRDETRTRYLTIIVVSASSGSPTWKWCARRKRCLTASGWR